MSDHDFVHSPESVPFASNKIAFVQRPSLSTPYSKRWPCTAVPVTESSEPSCAYSSMRVLLSGSVVVRTRWRGRVSGPMGGGEPCGTYDSEKRGHISQRIATGNHASRNV